MTLQNKACASEARGRGLGVGGGGESKQHLILIEDLLTEIIMAGSLIVKTNTFLISY